MSAKPTRGLLRVLSHSSIFFFTKIYICTMGQTIGKQWTAKSEAYTSEVHCIQVIRKYGGSRTWVIGVAVDIAGALLMLKAVSQAPVSECMSLCNVKCSCK